MSEGGGIAGGAYYRVEVITKLFGFSDIRRIQQLTQNGVLPTVETPEGRRYDLVPTIQRYVQYLSDKAYGKNRSEKELELKEQKLNAEIALKESQAELHQLKTAIAAGKYISVEEVTVDYEKFLLTFKKFALGLPARLTDMVSANLDPLEARRIEREIQGEISGLLMAFVVAGVTPEDIKKGKGKRRGKGKSAVP